MTIDPRGRSEPGREVRRCEIYSFRASVIFVIFQWTSDFQPTKNLKNVK